MYTVHSVVGLWCWVFQILLSIIVLTFVHDVIVLIIFVLFLLEHFCIVIVDFSVLVDFFAISLLVLVIIVMENWLVLKIESIVNEIEISRQRGTIHLENLVHFSDRLLVLLLELRVDQIDDFLKWGVSNHILQRLAAQLCIARWTIFAFSSLVKILVNACFAERAKTFINGVCISEESIANRTLQQLVKSFLLDKFDMWWQLFCLTI